MVFTVQYQGRSPASPPSSSILTFPTQHQSAHEHWAACLSQDQVAARLFYVLHNATGFHLGVAPDEAESQLLLPGGLLSDLSLTYLKTLPALFFEKEQRISASASPGHPLLAPKRAWLGDRKGCWWECTLRLWQQVEIKEHQGIHVCNNPPS